MVGVHWAKRAHASLSQNGYGCWVKVASIDSKKEWFSFFEWVSQSWVFRVKLYIHDWHVCKLCTYQVLSFKKWVYLGEYDIFMTLGFFPPPRCNTSTRYLTVTSRILAHLPGTVGSKYLVPGMYLLQYRYQVVVKIPFPTSNSSNTHSNSTTSSTCSCTYHQYY